MSAYRSPLDDGRPLHGIDGQIEQPASVVVVDADELLGAVHQRAPPPAVARHRKIDDDVALRRGATVDFAHERRALERGVAGDAEQLEDRRRQVDAAPQDVDVPGRSPGRQDHQRNVHQRVPHLEAMARHPVLAELLAMVGRDDDRRALRPGPLGDEVEQLADVPVGERDLAVVPIARVISPVDAVVELVEVVRVEEVRPEEEAAASRWPDRRASPRRSSRDCGEVMSRSVFASKVMPGTIRQSSNPESKPAPLKYMCAITPIVWTPAIWRSFGKKRSFL